MAQAAADEEVPSAGDGADEGQQVPQERLASKKFGGG